MNKRTARLGAGSLAVTVVAALAAAGLLLTPPPVQPHLQAGSIWLTSRAVGQVTLVDGAAAEVSAGVRVTGPNAHFDTEQVDGSGYAVDAKAGLVVGVDGATREPRSTTVPAGTAAIYATANALYVVDAGRRLVHTIDAKTLTAESDTVTLPGSVTSMISDGHTLWAADNRDGVVAAVTTDGQRATTQQQHSNLLTTGRTHALLAVANGKPVLVDTSAHTAAMLTPAGDTTRTMRLDASEDDLVTGSPTGDELVVVQKERGVVLVCAFADRGCQAPIPITGVGHDLGAAVELDGRVYVPDYTAGVVRIIDIASRAVRQTETVLPDGQRFELLQRDHFVYFNDPDGPQAGLVGPAGRLTRILKYEPQQPSATRLTSGPHPTTKSGPPSPSTLLVPTGSGHSTSAPSNGAAASGGTSVATTQTTATGPRIIAVAADPPTPQTGQEVTLTAQVAGLPDSWSWTVTRPGGKVEATAKTPQLRHTFTIAADYSVRLAIATGPLHDSQTITVTVAPAIPSAHCGEVVTTNVLLTQDLVCTGTALTAGASDITIDLGGHSVRGGLGVDVEKQAGVKVRNGTVVGGLFYANSPAAVLEKLNVDSIRAETASDNMTVQNSTLGQVTARGITGMSFIGTTFASGGIDFNAGSTAFLSGCTLTGSGINIGGNASNYTVENSIFVDSQLNATESDGGTITGNTFTRSSVGLFLSRSTYVHQNDFRGADIAVGISADQSQRNTVDLNTFEGNGVGVQVDATSVLGVEATKITNNQFVDNGVAGIAIGFKRYFAAQTLLVDNNTVRSNGNRSNGTKDADGHPVNDGIHVDAPPGSEISVSNTTSQGNADYGIEAQPGTVIDGGGNTSRGDPSGCLGVTCH